MVCSMYAKDDPLNRKQKRNLRNSDKEEYNCAGYALECFSWYVPYPENGCHFLGYYSDQEAARKTELAVQTMLDDFPTLRVIHTLNEVQPNEYAILFRLRRDGDFHYIKHCGDGQWRHKMGASYYIETISAKRIFSPWPNDYCGPIVMFAKRREK